MAQQPPPQQPDTATLAALVVIVLSGLPVAAMASYAAALLAPFGISAAAATASVGLLWPHLEHDLTAEPASAIAHTLRTQPAREAAYLWNAAKRIASDPSRATIATERRYLAQHLAAERGRRDAARSVDAVAAKHGGLVGWYAILDERTSPGCRTQNGTNFSPASPPIVEGRPAFPGAVHLHCRCRSGVQHLAPVREPARVLVPA